MDNAPIVLVPGFWLGAWAWDDVAARLRAGGHDVTALTLPGLAPGDDASAVTFGDHVDAICAAVSAAPAPVVLVVHSGAGFPGYAATDRVPERIAAVVYVDTGPGVGAMDPDFAGADLPLKPWDELGENLDGLTEHHLAMFRSRAVPQPGGVLREGAVLTNAARLDVPSTVVCTAMTAADVREGIEKGWDFLGGLAELRDVTYVDLPTSHWPMWSRPADLAAVISDVASGRAGPGTPREPGRSGTSGDPGGSGDPGEPGGSSRSGDLGESGRSGGSGDPGGGA
jgi:pimeloyl-ACP methyl ester carboxylesterase